MEYVRSCHKGGWRLFSNRPDIITRGRYYFAPEGTPHYPGMHNLWSDDWTYDRESKEEAPPLGEVRAKRMGWSRGLLGVDHPSAVSLGNAACIADGEMFPQRQEQRTLIAGVDSRCWSNQGVPVPDQIPLLWLKPDGLVNSPGNPVTKWQDASVYGNDCAPDQAAPLPVVTDLGDTLAVDMTTLGTLIPKQPLVLTEDFVAFLVVQQLRETPLGNQFCFMFSDGAVGLQHFVVGNTRMLYADGAGTYPGSVGSFMLIRHLYAVRRVGSNTKVFVGSALSLQGNSSVGPVPVSISQFGPWSMPHVSDQNAALVEVRVYPGGVTGVQFSAVANSLKVQYGIP